MKKKNIALILALVMFTILLLVACPNGNENQTPQKPIAIEGVETEFAIDSNPTLSATQRQLTIMVLDYIDLNEAEGVTFEAVLTEGTGIVTIVTTQINATAIPPRFMINAVSGATGSATIELRALVEQPLHDVALVALTIPFTVTVANSAITATSTLTQTGFTLASLATPIRGQAFQFSLTVEPTHEVTAGTPPIVTFTVSGTDGNQTVTGIQAGDTNVFNFNIHPAQVTGNIVLTAISGIIENTSPRINVEGLDLAGDFSIIGLPIAFTNTDYIFTVRAPSYYVEASISYRVGTTGIVHTVLTPNIEQDGAYINFVFTVPLAHIEGANVDTDTLQIIAVNLEIGHNNFIDSFWEGENWNWNPGDGSPANIGDLTATAPPVFENGVLTFTNTTVRNNTADISGTHISTTAPSDAWSQISFEFNTEGTLDMALFATAGAGVNPTNTNWATGNWIRLFSTEDGRVNIGSGQSPGGLAAQTATGIVALGEWNRIDFVYRRVAGQAGHNVSGHVDIRIFVNGVLQELSAPEGHEIYAGGGIIYGNAFRIPVGTPNYGHRMIIRTGEDNVVLFRRVEDVTQVG